MVEDKKELLANKAAELFLSHGYHNVTMKKLA
jgi:AcrR family transcriptional regulator